MECPSHLISPPEFAQKIYVPEKETPKMKLKHGKQTRPRQNRQKEHQVPPRSKELEVKGKEKKRTKPDYRGAEISPCQAKIASNQVFANFL
jgi:hypothetical protein